MVVAESFGIQDDRSGLRLQGQLGKIVREMFSGFDYYITSLVKCRPPENRTPTSKEIKACFPYLEKEIESNKPKLIIALGSTVMKALIKKTRISELNGQLFDYKGIPVMPVYHPAVVLRDPSKAPALRTALNKVPLIIKGIKPSTDHIEYTVVKSSRKLKEMYRDLKNSDEIAVDLETTGLNRHELGAAINTIQLTSNNHTWVIPLNIEPVWARDQQQEIIETVVEITKNKLIIGQNLKFDNLWLMTHFRTKFNLGFDTMLAHHILDENSPHGLKELAAEFCNAPSYDVDKKTKVGKGDINKLYKYAAYDTYYTHQLKSVFQSKLMEDRITRRLFYKLVMPLARLFERIEQNGLYIDLDKLKQSEDRLTKEKNVLLNTMNLSVGITVNWNSSKQVGELFYKHLKLRVIEKTPKGAPSTSESVLKRINHPIADMLLQYRGIEKNLSTYIVGWQQLLVDSRLFLSTKIHGTVTGRLASRLHQVPRDPEIRSHITAPPGWTFVCADYSQIELRIVAIVADDFRLKQVFQSGLDVHSATASFILGKPEHLLTKEERKMAKAVNFGLIYGMSWKKLVIYARDNYGIKMTDHEAREFRNRFFEVYSALPKWHEKTEETVERYGYVRSLSGRKRRLPTINSSDDGVRSEAKRQAINSPIQGFGSGDLKAMAMLEIADRIPDTRLKLVGEVHDSILMWIKTKQLKRLIPKVKAIMEHPQLLDEFNINMTVPLVADFEVGPWGKGEKWSG